MSQFCNPQYAAWHNQLVPTDPNVPHWTAPDSAPSDAYVSDYQQSQTDEHGAYLQALNDTNAKLATISPLITDDLDQNWVFEDDVVPVQKSHNPDNDGNDNDPAVVPAFEPTSELACIYYDSEYLSGSWPFTSNLHYPYGRAPLATSPTIADDDLAAVSHVLGYDNWARWTTLKHSMPTPAQEAPPAVLETTYHAPVSVPPHMVVPSQQSNTGYIEHPQYQNAASMYGVYPLLPEQQPEPPIMDHLPFPDESTSPYSCTTDSSSSASAQSPANAAPGPHDHCSRTLRIALTKRYSESSTPTTPSPGPGYPSPKIEVDYPMPMTWSVSPSCDSPDADPHHLHERKTHSIRPRESRTLRSLSPRVSPMPSKRAGKKPSLACLFCRARKIACGPPPPGSDEKTCNQCFRRQLECEYPLESRRGLRKKKLAGSSSKVNTGGPKVTIRVPRRR